MRLYVYELVFSPVNKDLKENLNGKINSCSKNCPLHIFREAESKFSTPRKHHKRFLMFKKIPFKILLKNVFSTTFCTYLLVNSGSQGSNCGER